MSEQRRLAARFAEVSGDLLHDSGEGPTFDAVVRRAVEMVPGCDDASITLASRRNRAETVAATGPGCAELDALQYVLGEGPCLDAAFDAGAVVVRDIAEDTRWPTWSARAHPLGPGSLVAIPLRTERESLGALNLYSRTRGNFDGEAVDIAVIFAAHATEAMSKARLVAGLETALESRHLIGIAQGVLAARYDISYEAAFDVLHRLSNDTNTKLREVARAVAETRDLPEPSADVAPRADLDPV